MTRIDLPMAVDGCSLDAAALAGQGERYVRLGAGACAIVRHPDRLKIGFAPEVDPDLLRRTIAVERGCCSFLTLDYDASARQLTVSADPGRPDALRALNAIGAALSAGYTTPDAHPEAQMKPVWVGCSGWNYRDWRGGFYPQAQPQRRWLELYAERFDTVEINATFYRLPTREAVATWVRQTPPSFTFAVKASRYLTHIKRLSDAGEGIARFYERLEPMIEAGRLGPVLWQLPEQFHRDDRRLDEWLEVLPPGLHTIEFRHPSWFCKPVLDQLRRHEVALTIGDHPDRPFQSLQATADWRYVRFHYGRRGRAGNYSAAEIERWARRIAAWRRGHTVYAYFNNDWRGFAPANARALRRRLS
ncbi:MAG: DUF72 domain-containing protein [Solirubrobacteraceae bacterium]